MYWELIKVGIKFDTLKFFQEKLDFSFNVSYKIEDIDNSMEIYFDKLEIRKYADRVFQMSAGKK